MQALFDLKLYANTQKLRRVEHDYYPTPDALTQELLKRVFIWGTILEPCAGAEDQAIVRVLSQDEFNRTIFASDLTWGPIDGAVSPDATRDEFWDYWATDVSGEIDLLDWVITNPPYCDDLPIRILEQAWQHCRVGCAFLLRLSFLEPTGGRAKWLQANNAHLSDLIIFNPRPKFRADTAGTDSMTSAWCVWQKQHNGPTQIHFVTGWK